MKKFYGIIGLLAVTFVFTTGCYMDGSENPKDVGVDGKVWDEKTPPKKPNTPPAAPAPKPEPEPQPKPGCCCKCECEVRCPRCPQPQPRPQPPVKTASVMFYGTDASKQKTVLRGAGDQVVAKLKFRIEHNEVEFRNFIMEFSCGNYMDCKSNNNIHLFKLKDKNGKVLAGPYDLTYGYSYNRTALKFSWSLRFKPGIHEVYITAVVAPSAREGSTMSMFFSYDNLGKMKIFDTVSKKYISATTEAEVYYLAEVGTGVMCHEYMGLHPRIAFKFHNGMENVIGRIRIDTKKSAEPVIIYGFRFKNTGSQSLMNLYDFSLVDMETGIKLISGFKPNNYDDVSFFTLSNPIIGMPVNGVLDIGITAYGRDATKGKTISLKVVQIQAIGKISRVPVLSCFQQSTPDTIVVGD